MSGNNGLGEHDWGGFDCFQPFAQDGEILEDLKIQNHMPGWRLCMGHLVQTEGSHSGVLDLAIKGTLAGFGRRVAGLSLDADPTVRAVRESLGECSGHTAARAPTSERLASRIMEEGSFPRTAHLALDFCNLLALRTMLPWSVVDATAVEFPMTFRPGEAGEKVLDGDEEVDLCSLPVIVDESGGVRCCPCTDPGDSLLGQDTSQVLLFCFTPLSVAHEYTARKQLSQLVSLTWAFRFVEARAYRPEVRPA